MFLASYKFKGNIKWGLVDVNEHLIFPSESAIKSTPDSLLDFIKDIGCDAYEYPDLFSLSDYISIKQVEILAPIPIPFRNIYCVGKNYIDHIKELENYDPKQFTQHEEKPIFFTKCTTSMNAPYNSIPLHEGITNEIDYEAELAVIIGKEGINIKNDDAYDYIFGYSILNDVTARDLQKSHKQWLKGKSLDGFCPMGPWIVTKDEIASPQNLNIKSYVNGEIRQNSNTKNMIFTIAALIESLSCGITLLPGDILATGTPSGVGLGMKPPQFLKKGDSVKVVIENIGEIKNTIG